MNVLMKWAKKKLVLEAPKIEKTEESEDAKKEGAKDCISYSFNLYIEINHSATLGGDCKILFDIDKFQFRTSFSPKVIEMSMTEFYEAC